MKGVHYKVFSCAFVAFIMVATAFFVFRFVKPEKRSIEYTLLPVLSAAVCFFALPEQHETYFALAPVFSLIGFIIVREKSYFIVFALFNSLLFLAYVWISFNYWLGTSVYYKSLIVQVACAAAFAFTIFYCYYLIFKNSSLYHKPVS